MTDADHNDPVVWMLLLERGRQSGDFALADRAKRELERLGIRVIYRRRAGTPANITHPNE